MVISTFNEFIQVFGLPISMSLIGGLIGHFVKNGIVELPKLVIEYDEEGLTLSSNWFVKCIQRLYYFLIFVIGFRNHNNAKKKIFFDLGFLGDLLIAIGTGILAKTALAMANTSDNFAVISSSLLAGYAGLSYLKGKQNKELADLFPEEMDDQNPRTPPA
ncbi:hypothetical protein [Paenibacillus prosopidis]|uniref:Uncharacterized protein n=1 Tax=Paenibacillus prosopidis TaxID=630520 RepID=A0A368VW05_9BACL|nr:hypothetical protein [Paenibacillus prosopidis]RCW45437.1 hypothetical protein DFP97_11025 [Paenibacillus prosopidis]